MMDYFSPYRIRREQYISKPSKVKEILAHGALNASIIANEVLERVRKSIGIKFNK